MTAERVALAPAHAVGGPSPRVQLARLAWETALATGGVAAGDAGRARRWQTVDRGEILHGVVVAAQGQTDFAVELHLVVGWPTPPLREVAATIRDRVAAAAAEAGLAGLLGHLSISFVDLVEPADEATS